MILFLGRVLAITLALTCIGCVSARDRAVTAANAATEIADGAHEFIARRYQERLDECLSAPTRPQAEDCGQHVNEKFEPAWQGYRVLRAAWLALAASVQAIDLLGKDVSDADLLHQMMELGEAISELQQAIKAIDTGDDT